MCFAQPVSRFGRLIDMDGFSNTGFSNTGSTMKSN